MLHLGPPGMAQRVVHYTKPQATIHTNVNLIFLLLSKPNRLPAEGYCHHGDFPAVPQKFCAYIRFVSLLLLTISARAPPPLRPPIPG